MTIFKLAKFKMICAKPDIKFQVCVLVIEPIFTFALSRILGLSARGKRISKIASTPTFLIVTTTVHRQFQSAILRQLIMYL